MVKLDQKSLLLPYVYHLLALRYQVLAASHSFQNGMGLKSMNIQKISNSPHGMKLVVSNQCVNFFRKYVRSQ